MLCVHAISASPGCRLSVASIFPVKIFISSSRDSQSVALLISAYKQWVWAGDSLCSEGYRLTPYLHFFAMLMRKNQMNFEDNKYFKVDLNVPESSYFITVMAILGCQLDYIWN